MDKKTTCLLLRAVELLRQILYLAADPQSHPAVNEDRNLFEEVDALLNEIGDHETPPQQRCGCGKVGAHYATPKCCTMTKRPRGQSQHAKPCRIHMPDLFEKPPA